MISKPIKCAIYTRKSSEEGLEQNFNSLQAQRDACEAYIRSQAHENWRLVPNTYDDGGYSGGSMERPALHRLLNDISNGLVEIVVVYKVDRLTRSLADFAKIISIFDQQNASFVSVTQQFNTTSSMGRLTLNVLLSFAQFEREITSERIRDKFEASKRKGMWMGGPVPIGYNVQDRKLIIDPDEARKVKSIFKLFVELGTISQLAAKLRDLGITSRQKMLSTGVIRGGVFMGRGALKPIIRNRLYIGEMPHKGKVYPGLHEAIISKEIWETANAILLSSTRRYKENLYSKNPAPLRGKLFDSKGHIMIPKSSYRDGVLRHRMYLSRPVLKGQKEQSGEIRTISANMIEPLVLARLSPCAIHELDESSRAEIFEKITRVELYKDRITIRCIKTSEGAMSDPIVLPIRLDRAGMEIIVTSTDPEFQPDLPKIDKTLVRTLVKAYAMRQKLETGEACSVSDLVAQFGIEKSQVRRILPMGFLAPDLIEKILDGRQPQRLQMLHLINGRLPVEWEKQRHLFSEI